MANKRSAALSRAVDRSEEFHGFVPRRITKVDITWPKKLVHLGHCAQVDYVTDKFDEIVRRYFHEFQGQCDLYAGEVPQSGGREVLIIVGDFKITADGIVG